MDYGEDMAEAMSIYDEAAAQGALSPETVIGIARDLQNDLDKDIETNLAAIEKFEEIVGVENLGDFSGMNDQALISLYALLLDPGSTVREGEANRIGAAQGWWDRLEKIPGTIEEGQVLSEGAREAILEVSSELYDIHNNRINLYEQRTQEMIDYIDPGGRIGVRDMVFRERPSKPGDVTDIDVDYE
jgi:hypothetical protein